MTEQHILYSFRRCPYAMRARMALYAAQTPVEIREVDLRNRPDHLYELSPKGTVPVLLSSTGEIIDESLDIMQWALNDNDPENWLQLDAKQAQELLVWNDGDFKKSLDRYKYPTRYPDEDCSNARDNGQKFLEELNTRLEQHKYLCGDAITYCDIAIFPFIRQFAHTDREWFYAESFTKLQNWLTSHLESDLFKEIMRKDLTVFPA